MDIYIEVLNDNNRAEVQAKAIAKYFHTTCESLDGSWQVKCNKELEDAFCVDDESFEQAINDVGIATGVHINSDDICF